MKLRSRVRRKSLQKKDSPKLIEKAKNKKSKRAPGKKATKLIKKAGVEEAKSKKIRDSSCSSRHSSVCSSANNTSLNSRKRSSSKSSTRRDLSSQLRELSISVRRLSGSSLKFFCPGENRKRSKSFGVDVECFNKKRKVVASTPLQGRKASTKKLRCDLSGSYWSPNARVLKNRVKRWSSSCSLYTNSSSASSTSSRKASLCKSCPHKSNKLQRSLKFERPSMRCPKTLPNKDTKKGKRKITGSEAMINFYLSNNFTSIRKKKPANVTMPSKSLLGKSLYSNSDANYTQINLLNKKKKLFSSKTRMFTKSPGEKVPKSILKGKKSKGSASKGSASKGSTSKGSTSKGSASKGSASKSKSKSKQIRNKGVRIQHFSDTIDIDLDKENKEFSIVKCDKEVSFRIKTSHVGNFCNSNNESDLNVSKDIVKSLTDNAEDENFIRSKDKTKTSINSINGAFDGSYVAPTDTVQKSISNIAKASDVLKELQPQSIVSSVNHKNRGKNVNARLKLDENAKYNLKQVLSPSSSTPNRNGTKNTNITSAKSLSVNRKKKKLLQSKRTSLFDLGTEVSVKNQVEKSIRNITEPFIVLKKIQSQCNVSTVGREGESTNVNEHMRRQENAKDNLKRDLPPSSSDAPNRNGTEITNITPAKSVPVSRKKKKFLHAKRTGLFDIEAEMLGDKIPKGMNTTTCNKTIMESVIHLMQ